jgi:DNA gyrase subunit A
MVTKKGVIKKTLLSEFEYQRRSGKIAISLDEGDELLFVMHTLGNNDMVIATADGNAVRFSEEEVRPTGRTSRGVRAIKLRDEDEVKGAVIVDDSRQLVTVTENGYGKRTLFEDFRVMKNRGGKGVICHNISDKTGRLAGISSADEEDDLMMITNSGTIIRTPVADIPVYSRGASGVIVMRLSEGQTLVNFTKVAREEDEAEEVEEVSVEAEAPANDTTEQA